MVTVQGLEPDADYTLYMKVTPADDQRYRYINMKWCATGETEINQNEEMQTYRHPSSPNSGQFWMKRPVSFKSIKITHYPKSKYGNVSLKITKKSIIIFFFPSKDLAPYYAQVHFKACDRKNGKRL